MWLLFVSIDAIKFGHLCDCGLTLSPGDPGGPEGPDFPVGPCHIHYKVNKIPNKPIDFNMIGEEDLFVELQVHLRKLKMITEHTGGPGGPSCPTSPAIPWKP